MSLVTRYPSRKPIARENTRPKSTFAHSEPFTPSRLPCMAMAEPGQPRDERMALAGGNAERPREHRPHHDGKHRGAEGYERLVRVGTEVYHIIDGFRHFR